MGSRAPKAQPFPKKASNSPKNLRVGLGSRDSIGQSLSCSLTSLKGGYIGDYIGEYYRGY